MVSGIIGAKGNNGAGGTGVCWNVSLYIMRAASNIPKDLSGLAVIRSINYAIENNIEILNLSAAIWDNEGLYAAMKNYTGLIVLAAGNSGIELTGSSPGGKIYDLDNVIVVASTDKNDNLVVSSDGGGSNYGRYTVDLAAPGSDILSTYPISTYKSMGGTSMAAPFVAGTAALVKSINPGASTAEVKRTILDNVDFVPELSGKVETGGRLNAYKAVKNTMIYDDIVTSSANSYQTSYTITLKNVRFGDGSSPIAVKFPTRSPVGAPTWVWYEGGTH